MIGWRHDYAPAGAPALHQALSPAPLLQHDGNFLGTTFYRTCLVFFSTFFGMVSCAVATCIFRWKNKKKYISFHSFPKTKKLRKKWIEACKRKDLNKYNDIKKTHMICSMHFSAACFHFHTTYETIKLSLLPHSCPTLNLPGLQRTIKNFISYEEHIE